LSGTGADESGEADGSDEVGDLDDWRP
jgi:hypothetical protein